LLAHCLHSCFGCLIRSLDCVRKNYRMHHITSWIYSSVNHMLAWFSIAIQLAICVKATQHIEVNCLPEQSVVAVHVCVWVHMFVWCVFEAKRVFANLNIQMVINACIIICLCLSYPLLLVYSGVLLYASSYVTCYIIMSKYKLINYKFIPCVGKFFKAK